MEFRVLEYFLTVAREQNITAAAEHDRNNPRSGGVMRNVGMKYQYSYEDQWQPKNFLVTFRMYQLNLDGNTDRVYKKYWDQSAAHFIEPNV